jgi:hypothetical protein
VVGLQVLVVHWVRPRPSSTPWTCSPANGAWPPGRLQHPAPRRSPQAHPAPWRPSPEEGR